MMMVIIGELFGSSIIIIIVSRETILCYICCYYYCSFVSVSFHADGLSHCEYPIAQVSSITFLLPALYCYCYCHYYCYCRGYCYHYPVIAVDHLQILYPFFAINLPECPYFYYYYCIGIFSAPTPAGSPHCHTQLHNPFLLPIASTVAKLRHSCSKS